MFRRYPILGIFEGPAPRSEAGYSLVEVMVSILLLSIAIIPMVGMFDTGLKTATSSGNYDKARTLANLKLEEAKSLPYDSDSASVQDVKDNFPEAAGTTTEYGTGSTSCGSGCYRSTYRSPETAISADFPGFEYRVEKQFLDQPPTDSSAADSASASQGFVAKGSDEGLIKVIVTVKWDVDKTYGTTGMVIK